MLLCACVCGRCVSVSRDRVYPAPRHRLLPHSGLRAVDADRHPVLGVLLDQCRRESGARLHRPADRVDYDDDEQRCSGVLTSRLLHQGNRRLDDRLSVCPSRLAHLLASSSSGLPCLDR